MASTLENQRATDRVPPTKSTVELIGVSDEPVMAIVLDESFGGMGVAAPIQISVGRELDVKLSSSMGGVNTVAIVRHVKVLPSGCRLGLEWKALALSRCLRDLLNAERTSNKHRGLGRILPGGLSVMWKLFEGGRWGHLVDCADRLRKEAAGCRVQELSAPIEHFQSAVRKLLNEKNPKTKELVRIELDQLIKKCIEAIS